MSSIGPETAVPAGLLLFLIILFFLVRRLQPFSAGRIVYDDLKQHGLPAKVLFSERYGLCGKPDLICKKGNTLFPVELKSMKAPAAPYPDHEAQLMAYCLLVEESCGTVPPYGVLLYNGGSFTIRWNSRTRRKLLRQLQEMRKERIRCTPDRKKCPFCPYRDICSEYDGS